jgi:hypothetical protein
MSLIRDHYRTEIHGGLADAGEELVHVFLDADACVLRERLNARAPVPGNPGNPEERGFGLRYVDAAAAAAAHQPAGTIMLRSDRLTTAELASRVLTAIDVRRVCLDSISPNDGDLTLS